MSNASRLMENVASTCIRPSRRRSSASPSIGRCTPCRESVPEKRGLVTAGAGRQRIVEHDAREHGGPELRAAFHLQVVVAEMGVPQPDAAVECREVDAEFACVVRAVRRCARKRSGERGCDRIEAAADREAATDLHVPGSGAPRLRACRTTRAGQTEQGQRQREVAPPRCAVHAAPPSRPARRRTGAPPRTGAPASRPATRTCRMA